MKAIGIDIGGTSIKGGLVDEKGTITSRFRIPIDHQLSQEEIRDKIIVETKKILLEAEEVAGIGIGCPGCINSKTGVCETSNNLHWENLALVKPFVEVTGLPTRVSNDANAAALGESIFGAGKEYSSLILLTLGTGIGGGIILDSHLFEGREGKGAELGHMTISMDGKPCTCGRNGCFEAYASVTALIKMTEEEMESSPESMMHEYAKNNGGVNGLTAFECAKKGDQAAERVVETYIHNLGEGILSLNNIFRPEAFVLGGGLSGQKDYLVNRVKEYLERFDYGFGGRYAPIPEILVSNLGNDAGILGAAALVFEEK